MHLSAASGLFLLLSACMLIMAPGSLATPTNGRIAYSSDRDHEYPTVLSDVYVINSDGTGTTLLTDPTPGLSDLSPDWSPDGSKIAWGACRYDPERGNCQVYVMNADGSGMTRVTGNESRLWASEPDWSPDGSQLVFTANDGGEDPNLDIYVINADGSGEVRLTDDPAIDRDPSWSPDGSKIAFTSYRDSPDLSNTEIYVMNADGSEETRITDDPENDENPDWSPDGSKIALQSTRDGGGFDIYVMNADGTEPTQITGNPYLVGTTSPEWSPDGKMIAYSESNGYSGGEIHIMNADGSGERNLTPHSYYANDSDPSWQTGGPPAAPSPSPPIPPPSTLSANRGARIAKLSKESVKLRCSRQRNSRCRLTVSFVLSSAAKVKVTLKQKLRRVHGKRVRTVERTILKRTLRAHEGHNRFVIPTRVTRSGSLAGAIAVAGERAKRVRVRKR